MSATRPPSSMNNDLLSLRKRCPHFRILVIGRAKRREDDTFKESVPFDRESGNHRSKGNRIDAEVVEGSIGRGLHDINNELIFKSNPQYIFHDSSGFESGSHEETNKVKSFIAKCAGRNTLSDQLHAIWYFLATDTNRPLLEADEEFFGTNVTGKVPVIAILSKCDAVISDAFQDLLDEGKDPDPAIVDQKTQEMLHTRFLQPLKSMKYPPADCVQLKDMHENGECEQLITKTAGALTDDQNNINLCIYYAVKRNMSTLDHKDIVHKTLAWFPHIWEEVS
ncbi:hypothetical protein B0H14DRAFT_2722125 [Mycena olivaceomarginata]|nr:hypothetical protein B0H14DRAFT_2722125 [Mycena olivaceomarginata]